MSPAKKAAKTTKKAAKKTAKSTAKKAAKSTAKKATAKKTSAKKATGKKATARKATGSAAPSGEMLLSKTKVKEALKSHGMRTDSDLYDALNEEVHDLLGRAARRAENNKRSTVRPGDI